MIQTKEFINIVALNGVDKLIDIISEKYHLTEIIIETAKELEKTDLFGAKSAIEMVMKIQQQMNLSQDNSLRHKAKIYEKLMKDGEENRQNAFVAVKFAEDALTQLA
jgi:hypothetical protein